MSMLARLKRVQPEAPLVRPASFAARVVPAGIRPEAWQIETVPYHGVLNRARGAVGGSPDLERIVALPRRAPVDLDGDVTALIDRVTARYAKHNNACKCTALGRRCIKRLNAVQAWALEEMSEVGGLLGAVAVGGGKSALDIFAALAIPNVKLAVLLVPPNLREQLLREYELLSQHFQVPSIVIGNQGRIVSGRPVVHVLAYSTLSRPESTDILRQLRPDLIISDEVHRIKRVSGAGAGRVVRHLAQFPETRFAAWSGTMTAKSIKDFAHISAFSLGENSPLPLDPSVVEEWALAIDPSDWPAPIGALRAICKPGEHVQKAFHRRLVETKGVVATKAGALGASLVIDEKKVPPIPGNVLEAMRIVRETETRPDGEELVDGISVARCLRELACGFFYRWIFPFGHVKSSGCSCVKGSHEICEPCQKVINEWYSVRKAWHKELRERLKHPMEHLDSPLLCAKAAIRYHRGYKGDLPVWASETWPAWREIRDKVDPVSEAVWVDDYLAKDAAHWALKNKGVIWYASDALGQKVSELAGLPKHGGGLGAETRILAEKGDRSVIASIHAHGTGRDGLQRLFDTCVVLEPPSAGDRFEQLLARLHRPGQESDEVTALIVRHTPELRDAFDNALRLAGFLSDVTGNAQKLLAATIAFSVPDKSLAVEVPAERRGGSDTTGS